MPATVVPEYHGSHPAHRPRSDARRPRTDEHRSMITAQGLTQRHGDRTVVTDLPSTVRPGTVTGFLGPDAPTRGHATVDLAVLGVLATAGEYSTGRIRATMTAVPRRLPVLTPWAAVSLAAAATALRRRDV
ncbi:hypothetical protein DKG34_08480 [Streptomyces sp. NWU49]|nr:hypothetical protein DKG34_08480 [Streptomyces sp. NWU49]